MISHRRPSRRFLLAPDLVVLVALVALVVGACGSPGAGGTTSGHTGTQVLAATPAASSAATPTSGPSGKLSAQATGKNSTDGLGDLHDMAGMDMNDPAAMQGSELHGFRLNVPLPRPRFVLTDTAGKSYDFAAQTQGKVTLLYFGYTDCPYQCPTTMADIGIALHRLPASISRKVTVVFVTTDPVHDQPATLRKWLNQFNSRFIGLTGSKADLEAAQVAAHVTVSAPKPGEPSPQPGSTAHGGGALAYGIDDYAHISYPAGTTPADLVRDLRGLVSQPQQH